MFSHGHFPWNPKTKCINDSKSMFIAHIRKGKKRKKVFLFMLLNYKTIKISKHAWRIARLIYLRMSIRGRFEVSIYIVQIWTLLIIILPFLLSFISMLVSYVVKAVLHSAVNETDVKPWGILQGSVNCASSNQHDWKHGINASLKIQLHWSHKRAH